MDASQIDKQRQLGGKLQLKESVLDNEEGYYHFKYLVLEYANLASQKNNEMMKGIYSQSKSNVNNPKQHDIGEFEVKGGKVKVDKEKLDKISDAEVLAIIKKYQSTKAAKNNPLSKISDRAKKQAYVKALEGFTFRAKYKEDMVEPLRDQLKWKEYKKK